MAGWVLLGLLAGCAPDGVAVVGEEVPRFAAVDMEGRQVELAEMRGEVVVLNVWATWCGPCRREMPALERMHTELRREGLRVVAVSIDAAGDAGEIRDFVEEYGLSFDILHDPDQQVTRTFQTRGVPQTFLIARDGTLLTQWIGRIDPNSPAIRMRVYEALDDRSGSSSATALSRPVRSSSE